MNTARLNSIQSIGGSCLAHFHQTSVSCRGRLALISRPFVATSYFYSGYSMKRLLADSIIHSLLLAEIPLFPPKPSCRPRFTAPAVIHQEPTGRPHFGGRRAVMQSSSYRRPPTRGRKMIAPLFSPFVSQSHISARSHRRFVIAALAQQRAIYGDRV